MLWRIAFVVDGRKLETVLAGISGNVLNLEGPTLVVNAAPIKGGKQLKQVSEGGTDQYSRVLGRLRMMGKEKGHRVVSAEIVQAMEAEKINADNYSRITGLLKERDVLKAVSRGQFVFQV